MKKIALLLAVLGAVALGIWSSAPSDAADHLDSNSASAAPAADLTDVFAWMNPEQITVDGNDENVLNLVLAYSPNHQGDASIDDNTTYNFHIAPVNPEGGAESAEVVIACTSANGWTCTLPGGVELTGALDAAAGVDGRRAFVGVRNDPFYFNLAGFNATAAAVRAAVPSLVEAEALDASGCPTLDDATRGALVSCLTTDCAGGVVPDADNGPAQDFFSGHRVMAISIQLPVSDIVDAGTIANPQLRVWASTVTDGNQVDRVGRAAISTALITSFVGE